MILDLDREKLAETFDESADPELLFEEGHDDDDDVDKAGVVVDVHFHVHQGHILS